jgi:hypothetical protein
MTLRAALGRGLRGAGFSLHMNDAKIMHLTGSYIRLHDAWVDAT